MSMMPLEAVQQAAAAFEAAGVASALSDAERLVAHLLGVAQADIHSGQRGLDVDEVRRFHLAIERRRQHEPLAYILEESRFRRLVLKVDRRVLIPRPETEVVVERCLERIRGIARPTVLDIGTGSGAIALGICHEHPGAFASALDNSRAALAVARENIERTGLLGHLELVEADLLTAIRGPFDLVVSNPPYMTADEFQTLPAEVRLYEPYEAIVGHGVTEAIADGARAVLRPGGWLVLECCAGKTGIVATQLQALGYEDVRATPDATGQQRVVEGRLPLDRHP